MKNKKIIIIFIMFILLFSSVYFTVRSQPQYWTALNYDILIKSDGTALVTAKFHPFTVYGKSLYRNKTIEEDLIHGEETMITEILLMFSNNPDELKYKVVTHLQPRDNFSVLCDVRNTGKMDRMQGAYILQILIYLNSSRFVKHIENNLYEIKIRDSYTSQNPNSWIDVLNVTFTKDIKIEKISWKPSFSHGPTKKTKNSFLWINFNQPEAPDFYVFLVELKNFKIATLSKITGKILDAYMNKNYVYVKVQNNSSYNGYLYVRIITPLLNQTRKIYVKAGQTKTTTIPFPLNYSKVIIELWSDDKKLDNRSFKLVEKEPQKSIGISYKDIALYLAIIGAIIVIISLFLKEKKSRPDTAYTYYSYPYQ